MSIGTAPVRVPLLDRVPELRHTGVVKIRSQVAHPAAPQSSPSPADDGDTHGDTRGAIIRFLLESGPITAGRIGEHLGLSAAGVRRHLDALIDAGDAQANAAAAWQHEGRGRPAKRYQLTAAGRGKLEHTYDDLAVGGDAPATRTRRRRRRPDVRPQAYRRDPRRCRARRPVGTPETTSRRPPTAIADALTVAGYATTTTRVGGPALGVQICQHHCPVSHVAEEFPELCEAEQQAFAELLGTHVQRLATIVNGDCACTTHVPLSPAKASSRTPRRPPARSPSRSHHDQQRSASQ